MMGTEELEYPALRMVSGAGHNASYMIQIAPKAMIFVPSIGGRNHVEVEIRSGRIARQERMYSFTVFSNQQWKCNSFMLY